MKRIRIWMVSFNPLLPFMAVALGVVLVGQNITYDIVIP